jgi:hypothetical protein
MCAFKIRGNGSESRLPPGAGITHPVLSVAFPERHWWQWPAAPPGAQENENIERLKSGKGERQSPVERHVNGHFQRSRQSRSPAT